MVRRDDGWDDLVDDLESRTDAVAARPEAPAGPETHERVLDGVLFLVSNAASYINGQVFAVDGGAGIDMLKIRLPR